MATTALVKKADQALTEKATLIQLVTFELDSEEFGVDVLGVREIIRMTGITKMPNAPDFVEGVIDLRGTIVPVISMRQRFMLPHHENDSHSRILVMELKQGKLVGFIVDGVSEVFRVASDTIQPPPDVAQQTGVQDCIVGILHHNERLLIVLDLNMLFDATEDDLPADL
jgi:purine-binding chemotaxis protein CheW